MVGSELFRQNSIYSPPDVSLTNHGSILNCPLATPRLSLHSTHFPSELLLALLALLHSTLPSLNTPSSFSTLGTAQLAVHLHLEAASVPYMFVLDVSRL